MSTQPAATAEDAHDCASGSQATPRAAAGTAAPCPATPSSATPCPATPWLSDSEQLTWRAFLAAHRLVFAALEDGLRSAGIPFTYYEILVQLSEAPERTLRMSELASFARTSRSRLSHAVERLESHGWVRREDCATDRRGAFAVLTEAGLKALSDAAPGHVALVRELVFDALNEQQQTQLHEISRVLVANLCPRSAADLG